MSKKCSLTKPLKRREMPTLWCWYITWFRTVAVSRCLFGSWARSVFRCFLLLSVASGDFVVNSSRLHGDGFFIRVSFHVIQSVIFIADCFTACRQHKVFFDFNAERVIGDVIFRSLMHCGFFNYRNWCETVILHLLPAGLHVAQPCRYWFYSVVQKWVFRPTGATRCSDKREIWHGGADRSPVPNFTFIGAEMWEYSPQNCQNFEFWS